MRKYHHNRQQPKVIAIAATAKAVDAWVWALPVLALALLLV